MTTAESETLPHGVLGPNSSFTSGSGQVRLSS